MPLENTVRKNFFLGFLAVVSVLVVYVFHPFLLTLLIAAAFAVIFHPLQVALRRRLKWKWLSSGLTVLIAGVIVIVPLTWIITHISLSASNMYVDLVEGRITLSFLEPMEQTIRNTFPMLDLNVETVLAQVLAWVSGNAGSVLKGTVNTTIRFVIGCFAFYIFIRDGDSFITWIIRHTPLPPKDTSAILSRMHATVLSIIQGNLLVCVIQGIITGVAMAFFGVPNPILWGTLTVFVAIAPGIGPSAIILPAGLYIFSLGSAGAAIAFVIIAMAGAWFMGNIVGPVVVSQGVKIHELWIIVSVIGGIITMGPLGFIVGPLAVSVFSTLIDMSQHVLRPAGATAHSR